MAFNKNKREQIHSKYSGHCAYCGEEIKIKDMQIDHIIPQRNYEYSIKNKWRIPEFLKHLTLADMNHDDNLNPGCRVCNKWKSTFDLEQFRQEIQDQANRLRLRSSNFRMAEKYGLVSEVKKPIIFYFESL